MRTLLLALILGAGCAEADGPATAPEPAPQAATASAAPQPKTLDEPQADAAPPAGAALDAPEATATDAAAAADSKLMFFLNPNGRPCKMQIQILEEMKDQLGDVPVERVSVLDQTSRPTLYQYGIRALPALILVDDQGRELHRFSPGIQSASSIMAAIEGANGA